MATGVLLTAPILQFFGNDGRPAVNGSVLTQVGGINAATYADVGLTSPLGNPIPLNSRGEISQNNISAQCFLTPNIVYTFTLFDAQGNQIWVATYVNGIQLTQAIIGATFYPPLGSEGTTVVNGWLFYGDVRRYGANSDSGVTSNQLPFQNAINGVAGQYPVLIYPGTPGSYYGGFTQTLSLPTFSDIRLIGGADVRVTSSSAMSGPTWLGATTKPFLWALGSSVSVTGRGTIRGPSAVTGSFGLPGGTVAGGAYVAGETGFIAVGPSISNTITDIVIDGVEFMWFGYDGIALQFCERAVIRHPNVHDCGYHGIVLLDCIKCDIEYPKASYIDPGPQNTSPLNCYGVSLSTDNHASATAGSSRADPNPGCIGCNVIGAEIENVPRWAGIDAHGGFDNSFIGCKTWNCMITHSNGPIDNTANAGGVYGSVNHISMGGVCEINQRNGGASTVPTITRQAGQLSIPLGPICQGGSSTNCVRPRIIGMSVNGYGSLSTVPAPNGFPINVTNASNYIVTGNTLDNWAGYGVYVAGNSIGGVIADNSFGSVASAFANDSCIRVDGCISPPIVEGNIHSQTTGTVAHFGYSINPAIAPVAVGINDFRSAITAQYGNNVGGALAVSEFQPQINPLVLGALGTPIATKLKGTATFAAAATVAVSFGVTLPNNTYQILLGGNLAGNVWPSAKSTTGFTLNCSSSNSNTTDWAVEQ